MLQAHLQPQSLTRDINLEHMRWRIYDYTYMMNNSKYNANSCHFSVMLRSTALNISSFPDPGVSC